MTPRHVIAPSLLQLVSRYANRLLSAKSAKQTKPDEEILFFCENCFAQFFTNALQLKIESVDAESKKTAIRILKRNGQPAVEVRVMIGEYIKLCDQWNELKDLVYGRPSGYLQTFNCEYLPGLMNALRDYARLSNDAVLITAVADAATEFAKATAKLCP